MKFLVKYIESCRNVMNNEIIVKEGMTMRDPRRIKRVVSLLQQIWEYQPDVRFN